MGGHNPIQVSLIEKSHVGPLFADQISSTAGCNKRQEPDHLMQALHIVGLPKGLYPVRIPAH
nr:hypothetical protein CJ188_05285 [Actinomyces sp. UMB0918]